MNKGDLVELVKALNLYEQERLGQVAKVIVVADTSRGVLLYVEYPDGAEATVYSNQVRLVFSI